MSLGYCIAWSPDGHTIAFSGATAEGTKNFTTSSEKMWTVNVGGGEIRSLTNETWTEMGDAKWMPDGSSLVVIGVRPHLRNQIYFLSVPSGEVRRITHDTNGYGNFGLGITADGTTLVADAWEFQGRIWTMNANGDANSAVLLATGNTTLSSGLTALPDGRIVFGSRTEFDFDLWTMSAGDLESHPLTSDAFYDNDPVAAPDGSFIIFTSDRAGTSHLFRINPDGSELRRLTFGDGFNTTPDISPDGQWVVYHSLAYNPATSNWMDTIWKIPCAGSTPVQLTDYSSLAPAFSPDGKMISCIIMSDNYQGKIAVIGADGGAPINTFDVKFYFRITIPARWAPDGKSLIYRKAENQTSNLWKQDLAGGVPTQLTNFKSELIYNFAFSRDGKRLLLSRGNTVVNVIKLKNFQTSIEP